MCDKKNTCKVSDVSNSSAQVPEKCCWKAELAATTDGDKLPSVSRTAGRLTLVSVSTTTVLAATQTQQLWLRPASRRPAINNKSRINWQAGNGLTKRHKDTKSTRAMFCRSGYALKATSDRMSRIFFAPHYNIWVLWTGLNFRKRPIVRISLLKIKWTQTTITSCYVCHF